MSVCVCVRERERESTNVLFYVCSHRGDVRPKTATITNPQKEAYIITYPQDCKHKKHITYPQDYKQSI